MSAIDVDQLLQPVSEEDPTGEDLEYDLEFGELERAAEGKPEHVMGDDVVPAEDPNWRDVQAKALELFARTKDLRVGIHLTRSTMNLEGFTGLANGLALIRGMLENYWEGVHPKLDEEDDNDPTMRVNSMITLNDRDGFLRSLINVPLVSSRVVGTYCLRHVKIVNGEMSLPPNSEESMPEASHIDGAFMEAELEDIQATADAVDQAAEAAAAIDQVFKDQVGTVDAPDLSLLLADMQEIQGVMQTQLARRGVGEVEAGDAEAAPGAAGSVTAIKGEITSRDDVIRTLDKICDFFERNEPSSPVPLLLRRAQRLVSKGFLEILQDLTPDGVSQAESIGGVSASEAASGDSGSSDDSW